MFRIVKPNEMTRTATKILIALLDVEVDLVRDFWALGSLNRLSTEKSRNRHNQERKRSPQEDHCCGRRRKRYKRA